MRAVTLLSFAALLTTVRADIDDSTDFGRMQGIFAAKTAQDKILKKDERLELIGLLKQVEQGDFQAENKADARLLENAMRKMKTAQKGTRPKAQNEKEAHAMLQGMSSEDAEQEYMERARQLLTTQLQKKDRQLRTLLGGELANTLLAMPLVAGGDHGNSEDAMKSIFAPQTHQNKALTRDERLELVGLLQQVEQGDFDPQNAADSRLLKKLQASQPGKAPKPRNEKEAHAMLHGTPEEDAMRLYMDRARELLKKQLQKKDKQLRSLLGDQMVATFYDAPVISGNEPETDDAGPGSADGTSSDEENEDPSGEENENTSDDTESGVDDVEQDGQQPVRRVAPDGIAYTKEEFVEHFGGTEEWDAAEPEESEEPEQPEEDPEA